MATLQDPPELIEEFVAEWRKGFDVVYGRRVKREAPLLMRFAYKAFYRVFDYFSYVRIPHDAGDFSLLDKRVVRALLQFPERDLFLRGLRAFAGFKQTGVDYVRPERMFGRSTNNLWKNIGWAKKGILSFSNTPLNMLSFLGVACLIVSLLLGAFQIGCRLIAPELVPPGLTTVLVLILLFGSLNLFAISLVGEYGWQRSSRSPSGGRCSFGEALSKTAKSAPPPTIPFPRTDHEPTLQGACCWTARPKPVPTARRGGHPRSSLARMAAHG